MPSDPIATGGSLRVLLIEDRPSDVRLVQEMLKDVSSESFLVQVVGTITDALPRLRSGICDIVLLDLTLPDSRGLATFEQAYEANPDLPILLLTGQSDEKLALQAMRAGAQDYVVKGTVDAHTLGRTIRYAVERKRTEERLRYRIEFE
ncbi:MAG: response regulator, partial [Propionibacteriaceae bacterium]|nr:response regulator [Propionibacteriaceae bacterium]